MYTYTVFSYIRDTYTTISEKTVYVSPISENAGYVYIWYSVFIGYYLSVSGVYGRELDTYTNIIIFLWYVYYVDIFFCIRISNLRFLRDILTNTKEYQQNYVYPESNHLLYFFKSETVSEILYISNNVIRDKKKKKS